MAIEAQGTLFEIETGDDTEKAVTGIEKEAYAEVTAVAHGFVVGEVVNFAAVVGMVEINNLSAMIVAVTGMDSFRVALDTSGFSDYVSGGTATPVEFTEVGEIVDWDGPGGSASVIDVTHLQSAAKEKMIGLMDEGQISLTVNLDLNDTGQLACQTARTNRAKTGFRLTYSDDEIQTFDGYVLGFSSSGSVDDKVSASITIEITGVVTTA